MKLREITLNPSRDEYIQEYVKYFENIIKYMPNFNTIYSLDVPCDLKVAEYNGDLLYGLFTPNRDTLLSVLFLVKYKDFYQVQLIGTELELRNRGLVRILFDYAVKTDNIAVLSDTHQTKEAKLLWFSFLKYRLFNIYIYSISKDEIYDAIIDDGIIKRKEDDVDPYSGDYEQDLLLLAKNNNSNNLAKELTNLNESRKYRKIYYYGSSINEKDYP